MSTRAWDEGDTDVRRQKEGLAIDEVIAIRRKLHSAPELSFSEFCTGALVAELLRSWGVETHVGVGGTGVVGVLSSGSGRRSIGLRADMDALPVEELNVFEHRSQHNGVMHACGHDGHTAMLLGAARYLAKHRQFDGQVVFIFQPAEEGGYAGARAMIEDGLFERFHVDEVYGIHNWPGMPAGKFGVRVGPMMASLTNFEIEVTGKGCHAAMPHSGRDALLAANHMVAALQTVITRSKDPVDTAVLSVTQFHAGDAMNVIPDSATFAGTIRCFSEPALDQMETEFNRIVNGVALSFDCSVKVVIKRLYPATTNHYAPTQRAIEAMRKIVEACNVDESVAPTMGAEDFAHMLLEKPGCYAFLGNDRTAESATTKHANASLHSPHYDFNDGIVEIGVRYWIKLVDSFFHTFPAGNFMR